MNAFDDYDEKRRKSITYFSLVSGGISSIGLAIAKAFKESGAKVIIAGTNEKS